MDIPMRDRVKLSTDLYFPETSQENEKFPVILIRTPYKKEMSELEGLNWAKNGYVCAIQDVRGRFASQGEWEPMVNEAKDGYDTIEWLAVQEWSTGKVGMIGGSYLGMVQLQAAVQKPPHLVTIIPNVAPPDPFFNIPYEYGSFMTWGALWWAEVVETEATADLSGKKLFKTLEGKDEDFFKTLPVIDLDKKLFGKENHY
jgi:putative CocE/NonD family hydrolase